MALPPSIVQIHTQQYKTFEKIFVYLNATAGSSVWRSPGTFPEAKTFHYVIDHGFSVQGFAEELAFPFHPCKPFPLPPLPVVPLPFTIVVQDFVPIPFSFPLCWFHCSWFSVIIWFGQFSSLLLRSPNFPFIPLISEHSNLLLLWYGLWYILLTPPTQCMLFFFPSAHHLPSVSILLSMIYPLGKKKAFLTLLIKISQPCV